MATLEKTIYVHLQAYIQVLHKVQRIMVSLYSM